VYDRVDEETGVYILSLLPGSDCRRVSRFDGEEWVNADDATFWCNKENEEDPWFIQQVIDPEGDPVTGGTVTFSTCTDRATGAHVPSVYCFHVGFSCNYGWQEYATVEMAEGCTLDDDDGCFAVQLDPFTYLDDPDQGLEYVWGMRWAYTVDDRTKPEWKTGYTNFASDGWVDPHQAPPREKCGK
jgi:hypothetical protein